VRKSFLLALALLSPILLAEDVSLSVTVLDAPTTLSQHAVPSSLPSPGWATFTCNYRYSEGAVFNGKCRIIIDSSSYDALPPSFTRPIFLSAGTHAWRCECSGDGFAPASGAPEEFEVGSAPAAHAPEERTLALQLIVDANESVAEAKESGLDTREAESYLKLAALALAQNDTTKAVAFASDARAVVRGAPPRSATFALESFSWIAPPAIAIAAITVVVASLYFFRSYVRKREGG